MAFSVLECEEVCGGQWLHRDQQEPCWDGRHLDFVLFVSLPALVIFLILFPVGIVMGLWRRRSKLYRNRRLTFRFGMLYSGYRRDYWSVQKVVGFFVDLFVFSSNSIKIFDVLPAVVLTFSIIF